MKGKLLFTCLLLAYVGAAAQQAVCGFDMIKEKLLNTDPSFKQKEEDVNHLLYKQAINPASHTRNSQSPLVVPVVVHVVHENGPENISDSLVIAGIDQLNLRFQNAAPYFDATGTDIGIQFCLASVDPYGNPTTGITRNLSAQTDLSLAGSNDLYLKNLNRWDPHLYLNVWVIKNTGSPGIAGYATYPSSMGTAYDGIVILYNYFYSNSALAHEAGHYFGLYHTFNGGCINANCLLDGDQVCDTPPDATNTFNCPINSCSTEMNDTSGFNPFLVDGNDAPNYMDYTNCPLSFTTGQSNRMNASLTQIRTTLLQSNGCGQHPGGAIPVASFTATTACGGTALNNTSLNAVGAQWDLNSDGLIDDCGNSFTYNAPVTGYYNVTLYAQGYGGVDTISQMVFVQHYPYQNYPMINGYSGLSISVSGQVVACEGATVSFHGEPGMAHYYWSTGDTTQNTTFIAGPNAFTISLTTIDSSGLTWSTCYPVHVEPRPAPIPPVVMVDPNDTIFCIGQPIDLLFTYSPIWQSGSFAGIVDFHNSSYAATLANFNNFFVNQTDTSGCMSVSNSINIIAQTPTNAANIVLAGGNFLLCPGGAFYQWYLDGVPIAGATNSLFEMTQTGCYKVFYWWFGGYDCGTFSSDSVCIVIDNIQAENHSKQINLFPNPVTSELNVITNESGQFEIVLFDITSRRVFQKKFISSVVLDIENIAKGIYSYEMLDKNGILARGKIVKD